MIPRTSSVSDKNETPSGAAASQGTEETDNPSEPAPLELGNMMKAIPRGKKRQEVKTRDWKSSVQVYNDL